MARILQIYYIANRMRIWTIQSLSVWESLERSGIYRACREDIHPGNECFIQSYGWMMAEMTDRIGDPPTKGVFPIWGWY